MTTETVFDLASLTKPLATTLAVMKLVQDGRLNIDQTLGEIIIPFKKTDKENITVRHLLCHNSGLIDYRPFYIELAEYPHKEREYLLRKRLTEETLVSPIGKQTLYSDLGFMILRWVVETVSSDRLDRLVTRDLYAPMDCRNLFFPGVDPFPDHMNVAATEKCPWRQVLVQGAVHDENAWILGGVEGHAGLFGSAGDIHKLVWNLLDSYYKKVPTSYFNRNILSSFFHRQPDSDRALGFDTPSPENASCGEYFSSHSIGHLGFTGTSFWVDLEKSVVIILLTNRVHPSRDNIKIREFRPRLHNAVMEAVASKEGYEAKGQDAGRL